MTTQSQQWQALMQHQQLMQVKHLKDLHHDNPDRHSQFSFAGAGILLDYSNNHCDHTTVKLLAELAEASQLKQAITDLFSGQVVNRSENQPALHSALRNFSDTSLLVSGKNILLDVRAAWEQMDLFSRAIREGTYCGYSGKPIKHIVNIGIGGSDLGPKMAISALSHLVHPDLKFYFVSNLDEGDIGRCLQHCDPETTLFIVSSKSFSTHETLANLKVARNWLANAAHGKSDAASNQIIAVSSNVDAAIDHGFSKENILPFWRWVGGRYSIWSAVSLSLAIAIGMDQFKAFLAGAHAMDQHFAEAPFTENLPVMLGMLRIWYNNFFNFTTQAIIPYTQNLSYFPEYLQQLFMESLGKSVKNDGSPVFCATGGIIWGGVGTNTQHSFHQLLLQGTQTVPTDFIFPIRAQTSTINHEEMIANCLAQSEVFTYGDDQSQNTSKTIKGNIPHNIIMLDEMSPHCLGALIALYEHKAYVQSVIWGINPFDQWGVQRGKVIMPGILAQLRERQPTENSRVNGIIELIAGRMHEE